MRKLSPSRSNCFGMWALDRPWTPPRRRILDGTPLALIVALGAGWLAVAGLAAAGWMNPAAVRIASITVVHGGLIAVALTWAAADTGTSVAPHAPVVMIALIAAGATASELDPRAALIHLAAPAWLAVLAGRRQLIGLGLGPDVPLPPVLIGVAIGGLLGGHLLVSASQTLGHPLRAEGWLPLLGLWAYD